MPGQLALHVRRMHVAGHLFANWIALVRERGESARIVLGEWRRRSRSRRRLTTFNDRLLMDIGINRSQAEAEAAKWFWQR
jgi:uncharacterized protein YjiS (DUF1127 family)